MVVSDLFLQKEKKNQTLNIQAECTFASPLTSLLLSVQLLSRAEFQL